jgi:cytochrome c553
VCALAAASVLAGCRQDMQDQPKFVPQRGTDFYADGRSARPQVENTVARGQLREDAYFYTGMQGGKEGDGMPFPVTMEVLERGQERYNVYCTPCHSRVGNGAGMIVQRGYRPAGNFHTQRLLAAPLGHFFHVMTNGYGAMPDYSAQLSPQDRWAVVAYIKALQLSQAAKPGDAAAGAQVAPLDSIAEGEGLPGNFAAEWALPPTAVYGTPNEQDNGIPDAVPGKQ